MANTANNEFEEESISKCESIRLKALAEQAYTCSDLKLALKYTNRAHRLCPTLDGVTQLLTAFKIITVASTTDSIPHWYEILEVEPFCHINLIKKQYKKLALILHPDKNTSPASEDAFKLVNEAFSVMSDKIRRKEYDMKLRIAMQEEVGAECDGSSAVVLDTFWTACTTCRLLHQFERKYLGHNLMCPNCRKSFKAVEVDNGKTENVERNVSEGNRTRTSSKRKMSSVGDIMKRSEKLEKVNDGVRKCSAGSRVRKSVRLKDKGKIIDDDEDEDMMTLSEMKKFVNNEDDEEMMTLAQMQKLVINNDEEEDDYDEETMTLADMLKLVKMEVNDGKKKARMRVNEKGKKVKRSRKSKNEMDEEGNDQDDDVMTVEDSDFYDFDKLRVEKSFKKGQIWAIYDDDDGMPRNYGLINEVVSTNPFEVDMSWLDPQTNPDEELISLERTGFHISCGRFKVASKTSVGSLNVFSHIVNCERAAREVYRIFPKKGSVWALYSENGEIGNRDNRCYDIVVFLTSYSEVHGLSMGYLEKVNGFKTIFRRREIGCHAVKWLEKHEARLFSHQIPARKVSGDEVPDVSGDCWELDPASLPKQLLITG
ncbi:uncharacterized protein [Rutidosis leptorrhynchoides]|uniref:uncharacterized protein n=1 Tax=Rutidosis leptorrhynchoides TaxID=125765 RepID=UPI003A9A534E